MRQNKVMAAATLLGACGAAMGADPVKAIQVRQATLLSAPQYMADPVGTLKYRDQVQVKGEQKPFVNVTPVQGGKGGWIHESSLTAKTLDLKAAPADPKSKASLEDVALAGRGMDKDVEAKYRAGHPKLVSAYSSLDKALADPAQQVSPAEVRQFMKDGKLTPATGGGK